VLQAATYVYDNMPEKNMKVLLQGEKLFEFVDGNEPIATDVEFNRVWVRAMLLGWPQKLPAEYIAGGVVLKFDDKMPITAKVTFNKLQTV